MQGRKIGGSLSALIVNGRFFICSRASVQNVIKAIEDACMTSFSHARQAYGVATIADLSIFKRQNFHCVKSGIKQFL